MICSLFGRIRQKSFSHFFLTLTLVTTIPSLFLDMSLNKEHISLLHLDVTFCDDKLTTDLHVKPTDSLITHRHIPAIQHGLLYIVYNQRLSRIFPNENDFAKRLEDTNSWFRVWEYRYDLVKNKIGKASFSKITGSKSKNQGAKSVLLVVSFHPKLTHF